MASKAPVLNDLIINREEGLDVCLWKLMADRVGRTRTEIGEELVKHGFSRRDAESRAESKMRSGWFERDEIKSKGITKYILKRETRMPQVSEVEATNVVELDKKRQSTPNKTQMQEALERAMKSTKDNQPELPINNQSEELPKPPEEVIIDASLLAPVEDERKKAMPILDLKNGLSTTIWDAMCDFAEYTKEDVMVMLEVVGANPATTRIRLKDLELNDWFDVTMRVKDGKNVKHYSLKGNIMRPVDEKPYRAQVRKQGEPVKAEENKRVFNNEEVQSAIDAYTLALQPGSPYRLGTLTSMIEDKFECTVPEDEVRILINTLVEKGVFVYVGKTGFDDMWMIPEINMAPSKGSGESLLGEKPLDPIGELGGLSKDRLTEFANGPVAAPEGTDLIAKKVEDAKPLTAADISDLELDLWTAIALNPNVPFSQVRAHLNNQGYDDTEIDDTLAEVKDLFIQYTGGGYCIPPHMATQTLTKERLAVFKNRAGVKRVQVEKGQQEMVKNALADAAKQAPQGGLFGSYSISGSTGAGVSPSAQEPTTDSRNSLLEGQASKTPILDGVMKDMANLDYVLGQTLADNSPHSLSDLVAVAARKGFDEHKTRMRVLELAGVRMKVLMPVNTVNGMAFRLGRFAKLPEVGEFFEPIEAKDNISTAEGVARSVKRLLSLGERMTMADLTKWLILAGFEESYVKLSLDTMALHGFLAPASGDTVEAGPSLGMLPLPTNPDSLDANDGIDRNLWLLLADGNWHRTDMAVAYLSKLGYRPDRVQDHVERQLDKDGFLIATYVHNTQVIHLKPGTQCPDRAEPRQDERRGAPASSGFHSYTVGGEQAGESGAPLLQVDITVAGISFSLQGLLQLANELRQRGYGTKPWNTSAGFPHQKPILQTKHTIGDREFTDEQLDELARQINAKLGTMPPMAPLPPQQGMWSNQPRPGFGNGRY